MDKGNYLFKAGEGAVDTGRKWVDASGVAWPIYRKTLTIGALPNATTKNVAHGESPNIVSKYTNIVSAWASDGTTVKTKDSTGLTFEVNATNVVVAAVANLSTFINGVLVLEFCK